MTITKAATTFALLIGLATLSGCSPRPSESAEEFAHVVAEQAFVVRASGDETTTGLTPQIDLIVDVDPSITDNDLQALVMQTSTLGVQHHWGVPFAVYQLGRNYSVSSGANDAEFRLFNSLRRDASYDGVIDDAEFLVQLRSPKANLLNEWRRLQARGEESGGLDNYRYSVYSADGSIAFTGEGSYPPTSVMAEYSRLSSRLKVDEASGWSVKGGDRLDIWVPDAQTRASAEALVTGSGSIEVHVFLTGADANGSCLCSWRAFD